MKWTTFLVSLLLAIPAVAQHPSRERGFSPEKVYQIGDIDHVNIYNGNLTITIPIGPAYPVDNGWSYSLILHYNSKVWDYNSESYPEGMKTRAYPHRRSNAGIGWILSAGRLLDPADDPYNERDDFVYESPDGNEHIFFLTLHNGNPHPTPATSSGILEYKFTRDGSHLRMRLISATKFIDNVARRDVDFPNGQVHRFKQFGTNQWRLEQIFDQLTDANGQPHNWVKIEYFDPANNNVGTTSSWRITDKHQRVHTVNFVNRSVGRVGVIPMVSNVVQAAFGLGNTATYLFDYGLQNENVTLGCNHEFVTGEVPTTTVSVPLLKSITLPEEGSKYQMVYYLTDSGNCARGSIDTLTLPTGGKIQWTYQPYWIPGEHPCFPRFGIESPGVAERRLINGTTTATWKYSTTFEGAYAETFVNCGTVENPDYPDIYERLINTVQDPLGDKTVHYFTVWSGITSSPNGALLTDYSLPFTRTRPALSVPGASGSLFLSQEIQDCNSLGQACQSKRNAYVQYELELSGSCSPACPGSHRRLLSDATVFLDDAPGCTATTTCKYAASISSSYDGLGHYRTALTKGNFGTASEDEKTTTMLFNPLANQFGRKSDGTLLFGPTAPWILNTYTETIVTQPNDGSQPGPTTVKRQYCFNASTGFLDRERIMGSTSPLATDVVVRHTPDSVGNRIREEYFGGDPEVQTVSTAADLCALSLPVNLYQIEHTYSYGMPASSRYVGTEADGTAMTFKILDQVIDQNTGLVSISRDPALLATTLLYDDLGRLTWSRPAESAWTQYAYALPGSATYPSVTITHRPNGSTTGLLASREFQYDAFGRLWKEKELLSDNTKSLRENQYDALGRRIGVSEVQPEGTTLSFTTFELDMFGRTVKIHPPDHDLGGAHLRDIGIDYVGNRTVMRSTKIGTAFDASFNVLESSVSTRHTYDRQGRLRKVEEPVNDASAALTTYGYDVADRLSKVTMTAGGVTQIRHFRYDARGFLVGERHPEKAFAPASAYGDTTLFREIDARGHARRRTDGTDSGSFDLRYVYDRAERVIQVKENAINPALDLQQRLLKKFTYAAQNDTSVSPVNRRMGKLVEAYRYNPIRHWGAAAEVTESYKYMGKDGRPSFRQTKQVDYFVSNPSNQSTKLFEQSFSWNDLGNPSSLLFPECRQASGTSGCPATPRAVTPGYANGFLDSVPGFVTKFRYHPYGGIAQIDHGNGVLSRYAIFKTYNCTDYSGCTSNPGYTRNRPKQIATANVYGAYNFDSGLYQYDTSGNVTRMGANSFAYDALQRVVKSRIVQNGAGYTQDYAFDAFGNMTKVVEYGTDRLLPTDAATNRLMVNGATFDEAGNLTSYASHALYRDSFGSLMGMNGIYNNRAYVYTADDERLRAYNDDLGRSEWSIRDLNQRVMRQYLEQNGWTFLKDFIYRHDGIPVAQVNNSSAPEQIEQLHQDHLGSLRLLTTTWKIGSKMNYWPFGQPFASDGADTPLQFTSHQRDWTAAPEFQQFDPMHARYYSWNVGRFWSVDPSLNLKRAMTHPQSWNRYAYVENNPLNLTDPDGRNASVVCRTTTDKQGNSTTNCTATVEAQIVVTNRAERAAARQFARDARAYWNRQTARGQNGENIRFNVRFNIVGPNQARAGMDTLTVAQGAGRSQVQMTLDINRPGPLTPDRGTIYTQDSTGNPSGMRGIAPHETGHLFGLRDLYPPSGVPAFVGGPQHSIMEMAQPNNNADYGWWVLSPYNGNAVITYVP